MVGQVIWITGLSGAGKTTLANELVLCLQKTNPGLVLLDGDILRNILKNDDENIDDHSRGSRIRLALKYAQMCKLLSSQGLTVVIATISMFEEIYVWNKKNLPNYFEIYLKVPIEELRHRDPKLIYKRYDDGDLSNVAGLDLAIDEPYSPDLILDFENQPTYWENPKTLVRQVILRLEK